MQYTHHDFYSNFSASLKSSDLSLTGDIFANEISDFIVFDTDKIISALNKSDIKISKNDTDEAIVDAIIKNLDSNSKLSSAIAFIIAEGNELINNTPTDKQKQKDIVAKIADGIERIDVGSDWKESAMSQVESKAKKKKNYKRIIWNKDKKFKLSGGWCLVIGLGVITAAVAFLYYRQKSSVPMMCEGGNINPTPIVPITPTPIAPMPVSPMPMATPGIVNSI